MGEVNHEEKRIMIRWHGTREYKKPDVVGMRGYPTTDGTERYELSLYDGYWEGYYYVGNADSTGIGYEPRFRLILRYKELFPVIQKCEEHAYELWQQEQEYFDPQWEYVQQFQSPSEKPETYNENWDFDDE